MVLNKECVIETFDSRIKCEEHGKKVIFNNLDRKKIQKVTVDNCQITQGLRCDYLVGVPQEKKENFVELKGQDIRHAFKQLKRSIELLGDMDCNLRVSYIISGRSPLTSPEIQNERLRFRKNLNSDLIVKNNNYETDI